MTTATSEERVLGYVIGLLGQPEGHWPEYQFSCPFCIDRKGSESNSLKLGINFAKGVARCFRCEWATRTLSGLFRAIHGGKLLDEEKQLLEGKASAPPPGQSIYLSVVKRLYTTVSRTDADLKPVPLPPEYEPLHNNRDAFVQCGLKYLLGRGVTREQIEQHQIGFCATGEFAHRVIFPAFMGGKQVYFANRYAGEHKIKSRNPEKVEGFYSSSTVLLGFDECVGKKVVSIVEGPMDRLAHPAMVATLGKKISEPQIKLLEKLAEKGTEEFVTFRDSDADPYDTYSTLLHRLPGVSGVALREGDPWSRREDIVTLLASRHAISVADRVRQRFARK